jgi:FtsZ-interacting cell division protein ZipA
MKTLILGSIALVGLLLVGLQHQQLGQLRAENVTLEQSSAEADRLKADLANSTGNEAQDAAEIERLREQNRDLLKLRNEVNQLRDARLQFEKVSAENQRLQLAAKSAPKPETKSGAMQPILVQMVNVFDRGLSTPEFALQTFYWAQRERNSDELSRSVTPESWRHFQDYLDGWRRQNLDQIVSIEIVARRDLDATTVQLGVQLHENKNPQHPGKIIVTLVFRGGEWRVQSSTN